MQTVWIVVVNNLLHQYQYTLSESTGKWLTFADEQLAKQAQSQHPLQLGWWSERKEIAVVPDDPLHPVKVV